MDEQEYKITDERYRQGRNRYLAASLVTLSLATFLLYETPRQKILERKTMGDLAGLVAGIGAFIGIRGLVYQGERDILKEENGRRK